MKALLWKELRENWLWAALGCLGLFLAEFYALSLLGRVGADNDSNITITNPTFLLVTTFGAALVGGALAALQTLPERNRDRWAALLHRPVSRGVILGGKVAAGLALYFAAVGLPFLASALYAAWPGKFAAPFVPGLLLPGLHALASGAAIYAGSLLVCLHRGSWCGTRGVLLVSVAAVFVLQQSLSRPFLLLPVAAASTLLLAAWGTLLGEGARSRWPRGGWVGFVAVVLLGAQGSLLLLNNALGWLPMARTDQALVYTHFEVTREGQVLRLSSGAGGEDVLVTDAVGNPVTDERYTGSNSYANFCYFNLFGFRLRTPRHGFIFAGGRSLRGMDSVQRVELGSYAKESWYLLVSKNYFVGYDNLSRRYVGLCDRDGFKPAGARPVPFDPPVKGEHFSQQGPEWIWVGTRLYSIDFLDRQMRLFDTLPDASTDVVVPVMIRGMDRAFRFVVVGLADGVRVLDARGQLVFTRPYLHDPSVWSTVLLATNPAFDRLYFQSQRGFYDAHESVRVPQYLDEVDLHGNVLASYSQPAVNEGAAPPWWLTTLQTATLPLLPSLLIEANNHRLSKRQGAFAFEPQIELITRAGWIGLALFALGLAAVTLLWARRVGFPARQAWGWAAFVFAFGPAGLLTFRLASLWPEQVRCPACGRGRGVDREECPHCHRPWPAPTPTGTEILQPLASPR